MSKDILHLTDAKATPRIPSRVPFRCMRGRDRQRWSLSARFREVHWGVPELCARSAEQIGI